MANASSGDPLHSRHAVGLWSAQTVQGTAVTPATAMGIVPIDVTSEAGIIPIYSIGSAAPIILKPGPIDGVPWSLPIEQLQDYLLLSKCIRSSGELPFLTLGFGYSDDQGTPNRWAWQVQDATIFSAEVAWEAGGPLSATLNGEGGLITELTTLAPANLSDAPLYSFEAVSLKGGAAHRCRRWRMNINNNVRHLREIPGTAPSTGKRLWTSRSVGHLEITGEITRFQKSGINMQADTISDFTLNLTGTDIAGGMTPNQVVIALTGVKYLRERFEGRIGDELLFTTPFHATGISISGT